MENLSDARLTLTGPLIGTPAYMSPEQVRRQTWTFGPICSAFGVLVYEMASGIQPVRGRDGDRHRSRAFSKPIRRRCRSLSRPACRPSTASSPICLRKRRGGAVRLDAGAGRRPRASSGDLHVASTSGHLRPLPEPAAADRTPGRSRSASTAQWWWEFHQVAVSTVYALMIYPAWRARVWLDAPWGMLFFFAVLAAAATSVTVRLHLRFTARVYPGELPLQRARARPWTRWSDAGFSVALLLAGLGSWRRASGSRHPVRRRVDRGRRRVLHDRTGDDESGVRRHPSTAADSRWRPALGV